MGQWEISSLFHRVRAFSAGLSVLTGGGEVPFHRSGARATPCAANAGHLLPCVKPLHIHSSLHNYVPAWLFGQ